MPKYVFTKPYQTIVHVGGPPPGEFSMLSKYAGAAKEIYIPAGAEVAGKPSIKIDARRQPLIDISYQNIPISVPADHLTIAADQGPSILTWVLSLGGAYITIRGIIAHIRKKPNITGR